MRAPHAPASDETTARTLPWTRILGLAAVVLTAGLIAAAGPAAASSTTHVVDPGDSIQDAIDAADAGDTVVVRPGTYGEALTVDVDGLTLCSTVEGGTACDASGEAIVHVLGEYSPAVSVEAVGVTVQGFFVNVAGQGVGIDASDASQPEVVDNRIETGIPDAEFGVQAAMNPGQRDYWLDDFVAETLTGDTLDEIAAERSDDEGFLGAQPVHEPEDHVALLYEASAPPEAHDMAAASDDPPIQVYEDMGEPQPLILEEDREMLDEAPAEADRIHPPQGIGPGALVTSGSCTANWVWQNQNGSRYFLGTAGHCVVDSGVETDTFSMNVCVEGCLSGRFGVPGEVWVDLEPIYAINQGVGDDFAIAEIPQEHWDQVRPEWSHWDGPRGQGQPSAADTAAHEGWGTGSGDTYPTHPRAGIFSGQPWWDQGEVNALTHTSLGDSGSAIGSAVPADDPTTSALDGDQAAGLITHLCGFIAGGIPGQTCGTNVDKASALVRDFTDGALDIEVVPEGTPIELPEADTPPLPPENVDAVDVSTVDEALVEVSWDLPSDSPPADHYEVYLQGEATPLATTESTTYLDEAATEGQERCYEIVAVNAAGASNRSAADCATPETLDLQPIPAPVVNVIDRERGDEITAVWTDPDLPRPENQTVVGYNIAFYEDGDLVWQDAFTDASAYPQIVENRTLNMALLEEGSEYRVTVRAIVEDDRTDDDRLSEAGTDAATVTESEPVWTQAQRTSGARAETGADATLELPQVPDLAEVGGPVTASPLVADLTGDGANEVLVVQDSEGTGDPVDVVALSWTDGGFEEVWRTSFTVPAGGTSSFAQPAVGDLDGDGTNEVAVAVDHAVDAVVASGHIADLHVLDGATGDVLDTTGDAVAVGYDEPLRVLEDADGDRDVLVLASNPGAGSATGTRLKGFALADRIERVFSIDVSEDRMSAGPVAVEDATHEGPSIALGIGDTVRVCDVDLDAGEHACRDVATLPADVTGLASGFTHATAAASIVAHAEGTLALLDPHEGTVDTVQPGEQLFNRPALGDAGGFPDDLDDVASAANDEATDDLDQVGDLFTHEVDGAALAPLGHLERGGADEASAEVPTGPVLADVAGDARLEILVPDDTGTVAAVDAETLAHTDEDPVLWTATLGAEVAAPLAVGDATGDGEHELLAVTEDGTLGLVEHITDTPDNQIGIDISSTTDALVAGNDVTAHGEETDSLGVVASGSGAPGALVTGNDIEASSTGVYAGAGSDGMLVEDNTILVEAGWCSTEKVDTGASSPHRAVCDKPNVRGVQADAAITVRGNTITADTVSVETPAGPVEATGTWGVNVLGDDVTVEDNTFSGWGVAGVIVWSQDAEIVDNRFEENTIGVQTASDPAETVVKDNVFVDGIGVRLAGGSAPGAQAIEIQDNDLTETAEALRLENDDMVVDARFNDWGVLREEVILATRVDDQGTGNDVAVVPYVDEDGDQHPPQPVIHCKVSTAQWTEAGTARTFQRAVDVDLKSLDASCLDGQRTIVLGEDVEEYRGATIDTTVTVLSDETGRTNVLTDGVAAGGARVQAQNGAPAMRFVDGSQGSTVDGVSVQGEPVGADGIVVDGLGPDSDLTVENARVGVRENHVSRGLVVEDSAGVTVASSVFLSGQPAIEATRADGLTVEGSSIAAAPVNADASPEADGIRVADSDRVVVDDNTIHGVQDGDSTAIRLTDAADARVARNLVEGSAVGIALETATDAAVADNVVVAPTSLDETTGIRTADGSGHQLARNLLKAASTGIEIDGTPGVTSQQDQTPLAGTGIHVAGVTGAADAPQLSVHNATLATSTVPLALAEDTEGLVVDATCNDWGAYQADLIEARIEDQGTDNTVDYQPWTSATTDPENDCLTPPDASFSATPDEATRLDDVQFTDESEPGDRPIVSWSWDFGDGATSDDQHPSHSYSEVGGFQPVLTVEDTDGMVARAVGDVAIENLAPDMKDFGDQAFHHTDTLVVDVSASDPEDDSLTLDAWDASTEDPKHLPANAELNDFGDGTGELVWSPDPDQYGAYGITVQADDGQPSNSTDYADAVVEVQNEAPVFETAPDQVSGAETRELTVDVVATEVDDPDTLDDLRADLSELPADATFTVDTGGDGVPNAGTLTWTPSVGENGTYNVTFTADGPGHQVTHTTQLDVGEEVPPPTLTVDAPTEAPEGATITATASADVSPDAPQNPVQWTVDAVAVETFGNDTLTYRVFGDVTISGNTAEWTGELPKDADRLDVTFTADDGLGAVSLTEDVKIQLHPDVATRLPVEESTGLATVQPIFGEPLTLSTDAVDEDGTLVDVNVTPSEGAAEIPLELQADGTWATTLTGSELAAVYPAPGVYNATYTVTDDEGLVTERTQTIHVLENTAPEVDASPDSITGEAQGPDGLAADLRGTASDPEGRVLQNSAFEWVVDGETVATGPRAEADLPVGDYTLELRVTDPYGATGTATVDVTVDDFVTASAVLTTAEEQFDDGTYRVDPTQHTLERLKGWVSVDDDQLSPVDGALVNVTATYHGLTANAEGTVYATEQFETPANGTARFTFNQQFNGQLDRGENLASAPGYHEVTLDAEADSRPADPFGDLERDTVVIGFWVGPEEIGPLTG